MNEIRARDIMKSPIVSVDFNDDALKIASLMKEKNIGSIAVEKDGQLVGLITKRDLIWRVLAEEKSPRDVKAQEIMSTPLVLEDLDATLSQLAKKMATKKIRRIVITKNKAPVGVVSERDIVGVAPEQIELLSEYIRILK
ncbi:MAG: CBS domain-containing protein [Candidatus Altiarchaeota archaeon]|nr:CBS domain-containing protein [Candidatus Altiarchaeota archaeon]